MDTTGAGNAMYAVRDIPGKGKGLVATRNIPKGTRILSERPLIHVPFDSSKEQRKTIIHSQVEALNKKERDIFLSFPNRYSFSDSATRYSGIFKTSSILSHSKPQKTFAIFPEACRINHDCDENAFHDWNCDTQQQTVHAMRDIEGGEEITIAYIPFFNDHQTRRKQLKTDYHFTCRCRACSLPDEVREERDQKISQFVFLGALSKDSHYIPDPIFGGLSREDRFYALIISEAAEFCINMCDLARGRVFAQKAAAVWQTLLGSDNPVTKRYTTMACSYSTHDESKTYRVWKTAVTDIPQGLGPDDFDDWLFKREKPRLVVPVGATIEHPDFFSPFSELPHKNDVRGDGASKNRRHWCFLGEISKDNLFMIPMSINVMDMYNNKTKVHFYTSKFGGTELKPHHQRPGSTVAILDATQYTFRFGPPGIRHQDQRMLKVFPLPLAQILALEHEVRSFSTSQKNDLRRCHGCDTVAISSSMQRCSKCWSFWYCSKDCQMVGWITKGHKLNCKFLRDPDLRGLFLTQWDKVKNCTGFPLKGVDGPC
ncbi:hypothetical protein E4U19_006863 [Claviceps sp. Clav32 group G5]|nr:hypothetical protein E4U19_006863 [Claviceps sp. Clav32 group G5]